MRVWPAQNSISLTSIMGAAGRTALGGSQTRGMPMVSATSRLPQAKIFPLGNRVICSGTMSQLTTGPHLPVVARWKARDG